jgi:hypothetical protein
MTEKENQEFIDALFGRRAGETEPATDDQAEEPKVESTAPADEAGPTFDQQLLAASTKPIHTAAIEELHGETVSTSGLPPITTSNHAAGLRREKELIDMQDEDDGEPGDGWGDSYGLDLGRWIVGTGDDE